MHPPRKDIMSVRPKQTTVPEKPTSLQRVLAAQKKRCEVETRFLDFFGRTKGSMANDTPQFLMDENQEAAYNTYVDKIGIENKIRFHKFKESLQQEGMTYLQQEALLAVPDTLKDWIVRVDQHMIMKSLPDDQRQMYQILKYITDVLSKKVGFMNIKEHVRNYLVGVCNAV